MSWLRPVLEALDARVGPTEVFFRDDDAGWGEDRLMALLTVFDRWSAPLDVAVIPAALTPSLTELLSSRQPRVRVHQHGYAHVNHEASGRRCEFGPSRSRAEQTADIARGRALLAAAFSERLDPVFTPPWNRCTAETGAALADLGISILSRDHTAEWLRRDDVTELPITVDWFGGRHGVRWTPAQLAAQLAARVGGPDPVGVMLHHAVTDDRELARVEEVLALFAGHAAVELTTMVSLAEGDPYFSS